jgi:hypothetical protein
MKMVLNNERSINAYAAKSRGVFPHVLALGQYFGLFLHFFLSVPSSIKIGTQAP